MKLSEMNTRQLAAALCQLTKPMQNIAADEALNGVFESIDARMKSSKYLSAMEKMGMMLDTVPILLETHYGDTIRIIAIMNGKSIAEVEAQNGMEMIDELRKSIDSQFVGFFRSSAAMVVTPTGKGE